MAFNKRSQQRIGDVVRRVERSPINGGAGKRARRPPAATGSKSLQMTLLHDDWATEVQDGENVNAKVVTGDTTKYYRVSPTFAQGKFFAGDIFIANQIGTTWYAITEGYMGGQVQLNTDMTGGEATADILPVGGEITVKGVHDFTGLKSGHKVTCIWCDDNFYITDIEDRIAVGTTDGIGNYPVTNPLGWNLLNGAAVLGVYKSGQYIIVGASCNS